MIKSVPKMLKELNCTEVQVGWPLSNDKNIISFKYERTYCNFYISGLEEIQNTDEGFKNLVIHRFNEAIRG